jgi:hypothetical protein
MNKDFFKRYLSKLSPFDGSTIYIESISKLVDLNQLSQYLNIIVRYLDDKQLIDEIYMCDDWIQHDGYLSPKRKVEKRNLLEFIYDENSLYNGRHGDALVHIAFYDSHNNWYLRIYIDEKVNFESIKKDISGRFDITLSSKYIEDAFNYIDNSISQDIRIMNSYQYFTEIINVRENKYDMPLFLKKNISK